MFFNRKNTEKLPKRQKKYGRELASSVKLITKQKLYTNF